MSKLTEKQLAEKIYDEKFQKLDLSYSIVDKQGTTFGINKTRLLIFSKNQDQLFYLEKDQKVPFQNSKNYNKGKKDKAIVTTSLFENPPKTAKLNVKYSIQNQKKEKTQREWVFNMKDNALAKKWADMLNQHKYKKLKDVKNPKLVGDTVISHLQSPQKKQNEIDDNDVVESFFLNNSNIRYTKQPQNKNDPNQSLRNSKLKPTDPNQSKLKPNSIIKPQSNSIIKPQNNKPNNSNITNNDPNNSRVKPKNESEVKNDWNYRFVKERTLETILDFQDECLKNMMAFLKDDRDSDEPVREYRKNSITTFIADVQTSQALDLKREFRNYHYIIESCKNLEILGVPLCCLIQVYGLVALCKADFPQNAQKVPQKMNASSYLELLQEATRIKKNIIFYSNVVLLNLTELYGSVGDRQRLYISNLQQYLPTLSASTKKQGQDLYMIRPQLLQYNIQQIVTGGYLQQGNNNSKTKFELEKALATEIRQTAAFLSKQQIYIMNIFDLKEYLHYQGINMKMLGKLNQNTNNKFVRRYLDTCLVAKLVKDEINKQLSCAWSGKNDKSPEEVLEEEIRLAIEGKNSKNSQYWKKIVLLFRKKWGFSINPHELLGPFFLSCLMTLLPAQYDIKRLDKEKIIFEDTQIIQPKFVTKIIPKAKSYHRFQQNQTDRIVQVCKYSKTDRAIFQEIVEVLQLESKHIPDKYELNRGKMYIMAYLSDFLPPKKFGENTLPCADQIYQDAYLLCEPPTAPSIKINLNYLAKCLEYKNYQEFKNKIGPSLEIIEYWLGPNHPQICQYYDRISDFEAANGNIQKCIEILEDSLKISQMSEAANPIKLGKRYNALGSRYLKAGRKRQALINLQNSKIYFEDSNEIIPEHAITLMKLSSLYLNNGEMSKCIETGKQALIKSQKASIKDSSTIRIYQILSRAFEISNDKDSLKKLGLDCAKKYNSSREQYVFEEMVKIGLTGAFAKISKEKSMSIFGLAIILDRQGKIKTSSQSLRQLMSLAEQQIVIANFINRCEYSDRIYSDFENKKALSADSQQFVKLLSLVAGTTGLDFIEGLNSQKELEQK